MRSWPDGALLPHALGFTGPLTAEQWPAARQRGLAMDAVIGQSGLEAAYDTLLRGQDGRLLVNIGFDGTVRRTVQLREARPGAALVLTVDSALQKVLQNALLGQINTLRTTRGRRSRTGMPRRGCRSSRCAHRRHFGGSKCAGIRPERLPRRLRRAFRR